jgi:CRP-like cAMP-binding protein
MLGQTAARLESGGDPGCIGTAPSLQVIQVPPVALLAGMSPSERRNVLSVASRFAFTSNETIFSEGYPADSLILVETGIVKLSRIRRDGREVILRICVSGEIIDGNAGGGYSHYMCSARATTRCTVLIWDSKQVYAMGILYPLIRTNLKSILANRLDELDDRFS